MPFDKMIEAILKEAIERGDFDKLPGRGKPVDLSAYFDTPEDVRMAYSILKNAGLVPQEIELLQEIAALKEALTGAQSETEKRKIRETIAAKQLNFDIRLERQSRRRRGG